MKILLNLVEHLLEKRLKWHSETISWLSRECDDTVGGCCSQFGGSRRTLDKSCNYELVPHQCNYELRGNNFIEKRRVKSVRYGNEFIWSLAPKIWEIWPNEIKDSDTLQIFKVKIKKWIPEECPCRLWKIYLPQVGFI